jgi:hypothetical protein
VKILEGQPPLEQGDEVRGRGDPCRRPRQATPWTERASKRTRLEAVPKLARAMNEQEHIKDEPPLIMHDGDLLNTEAWNQGRGDGTTQPTQKV